MKSRHLLAAVAAIALALTMAACGSLPSTRSDVVEVVAGESVWGDIVRQVGGSHVQVTSILSDPNQDPHEYESSDRNAIAIATARLVVQNGLGYDDFLPQLVSASGAHPRTLVISDVLGIHGTDANPHLWYAADRLAEVADAIATQLGELDPKNKAEFDANAKAFAASLTPLLDVIAQIRHQFAGSEVAYTERVPGYLVEAAGLRLGVPASFPQAVEDGNDPSPQDIVAFEDAIRNRTIKVLLYNAQVTDPQTDQIKRLAVASGVPVVGVTETLPTSYKTMQDWQLAQARELLTALQGSSR